MVQSTENMQTTWLYHYSVMGLQTGSCYLNLVHTEIIVTVFNNLVTNTENMCISQENLNFGYFLKHQKIWQSWACVLAEQLLAPSDTFSLDKCFLVSVSTDYHTHWRYLPSF